MDDLLGHADKDQPSERPALRNAQHDQVDIRGFCVRQNRRERFALEHMRRRAPHYVGRHAFQQSVELFATVVLQHQLFHATGVR